MHAFVRHKVVLLGTFFMVATGPFFPANGASDRCKCRFTTPEYTAVGTKAACVALMDPGGKSCVIEFSGTGANRELVEQLTGISREQYARIQSDVSFAYAKAFVSNDFSEIRSPKFITMAVPVLARGAYLREQISDSKYGDIKAIDSALENFSKENAEQISQIFLSESEILNTEYGKFQFSVGNGYVNIMTDNKSEIVVVVAPPLPEK